jgi:hypothetical protein
MTGQHKLCAYPHFWSIIGFELAKYDLRYGSGKLPKAVHEAAKQQLELK